LIAVAGEVVGALLVGHDEKKIGPLVHGQHHLSSASCIIVERMM
jgi:hypothetical protein